MNDKIKRAVLLPAAGIIIWIFTMCGTNYTNGLNPQEPNDFFYIQCAGVDKDGENIRLTAQGAEISGESSSETSGGGKITSLIYSETGTDMFAINRSMHAYAERDAFWGLLNFVIFGEDTAKESVLDPLDTLLRYPEVRLAFMPMVANGAAAKDIIQNGSSSTTLISDHLMELLKHTKDTGFSSEVKASDLLSMMGDNDDFYLPYIVLQDKKLKTDQKDDSHDISIEGYAIFKSGRLAGYLERYEAMGLNILLNKLYTAAITVQNEEGKNISLEINQSSAETAIENVNNKPTARISVKIRSKIASSQKSGTGLLNSNEMEFLTNQENFLIKTYIEQTISALKEMDTDVTGIRKAFQKSCPDKWDQIKGEYGNIFKNMDILIDVDSVIEGTYLIKDPM